jgi:RNase adaptor protein for sRNA GlmZ degradation
MRAEAPSPAQETLLHATTVALDGRAVLIRGAAGSGKSGLALQLIALGAQLVADDGTRVVREGGRLWASCPAPIRGLIEARGSGILRLPSAPRAELALVVDMSDVAAQRLPEPASCDILGVALPLLPRADGPHFAAAVAGALRFGPPVLPTPLSETADEVPETHEEPSDQPAAARVVIVTGPSGAGRTTTLAALEDLGYETIDNLPLSLVPRLLEGPPLDRPVALGIDVRNRDFSTPALIDLLDRIGARPDLEGEALYLDCRPDVLTRRYSETRRRHPLSPDIAPLDGILREIDLLAPIRDRAAVLIDTSELTPHELRAELERLFGGERSPGLAVSVQSFSYKRGLPRGLDMVFDVRFLQNPHWQAHLRPLTGLHPDVAAYVAQDEKFAEYFARMHDLVSFLLPAYAAEGKSYFSIGFGCTGGKHRSVTLAEKLSAALAEAGWAVSTRHRELERQGPGSSPAETGAGAP